MQKNSMESMQWDRVTLKDENGVISIFTYMLLRNHSRFKKYADAYPLGNLRAGEVVGKINESKLYGLARLKAANPYFMDIRKVNAWEHFLITSAGFVGFGFDMLELVFAYPAAAIVGSFHDKREKCKENPTVSNRLAYYAMGVVNALLGGALWRLANIINGVGMMVGSLISLVPFTGVDVLDSLCTFASGLADVLVEGILIAVAVFSHGASQVFGSLFSSIISTMTFGANSALSAAYIGGMALLGIASTAAVSLVNGLYRVAKNLLESVSAPASRPRSKSRPRLGLRFEVTESSTGVDHQSTSSVTTKEVIKSVAAKLSRERLEDKNSVTPAKEEQVRARQFQRAKSVGVDEPANLVKGASLGSEQNRSEGSVSMHSSMFARGASRTDSQRETGVRVAGSSAANLINNKKLLKSNS